MVSGIGVIAISIGLLADLHPGYKPIATEEDLAFAVTKLNHRPGKCQNDRYPYEVFRNTANGPHAI